MCMLIQGLKETEMMPLDKVVSFTPPQWVFFGVLVQILLSF